MQKSTIKKAAKMQRELEQHRKQKRMKALFWITGVCFVAIIAAALIFQPKAKPIEINYEGLPQLGSGQAPVKIVEFGDYKCPVCQQFSQQIIPQLKKDFIDTGKASLYFMNYTFIGPDSYTAALAAQSVYHQNKNEYWKFYDELYKNQGDESVEWATPEFLTQLAKNQGLAVNYDTLKQDIVNKTYRNEVDTHNSIAEKERISATPTLLINGKIYSDVFDYEKLKAAIEKAGQGDH